jgi:hypothetical protein
MKKNSSRKRCGLISEISARKGVTMYCYQMLAAAADQISQIIDDLMAHFTHSDYFDHNDTSILVMTLVRELTMRQPRFMQVMLEDSWMRDTLEITLARMPATRPDKIV